MKGKVIYTTNEWKGSGKQSYYYNQYRLEGGEVVKYKCHRYKFFDGNTNSWGSEETLLQKWSIDNPSLPDWLRQYINE